MAHRTAESSELLYWCKNCRDVTNQVTVVNNNNRAICTKCRRTSNLVQVSKGMGSMLEKMSQAERRSQKPL